MKEALHTCLNCGNEHTGSFCNQCGEKKLILQEKTVLFFFRQLLSAFTFADTKLLRSLRLIVAEPGRYSQEISSGIRVRFMKPISLFFLCNLIYFFLPLFETFNTSLRTQMQGLPSASLFAVEKRVNERMAELDTSFEDFELRYSEKSSANSKLMLIMLVFFFSSGFAAIGLKKKSYFIDHLTFALEYGIFILAIATILLGYLFYGLVLLIQAFGGTATFANDAYISVIVASLLLYFLIRGIRRFYDYTWTHAVLLGIVVFAWSYAALQLYRWLLFEVTFASM